MLLIGTVHIDLNGPRRLEAILNRFRPKKVAVEWSGNIDLGEIVSQIQIAKHLMLKQLKELKLDLPSNLLGLMYEEVDARGYEFFVPYNYCKGNGLELLCVDHPALLEGKGIKIPECLSQNSYEDLLREMYSELSSDDVLKLKNFSCDELRKRYTELLDKAYYDIDFFDEIDKQIPQWYQRLIMDFFGPYINDPIYIEEREKYMAEELLRLKPDMYIGGLGHMVEGYKEKEGVVPLFKRIEDPQIIRLCEADILC